MLAEVVFALGEDEGALEVHACTNKTVYIGLIWV
jgi:hypothetical protein